MVDGQQQIFKRNECLYKLILTSNSNMLRKLTFVVAILAVSVVGDETLGKTDTAILNAFGGPDIVMIVIFAATIVMVLVLLVKRQLLRILLISKRGAHTAISSGAPRKLAREIEASIRRVERLKIEPRTLAENIPQPSGDGLQSQTRVDSVNNLHDLRYRFKAIDSMTCLDDLLCSVDVRFCRKSHQTVRDYMASLQQPPRSPLAGSEAICDKVVKLYEHARYGKKEFGEQEYMQIANHIETLKTRLRQKVSIPGTLVSSDAAGSSKEVSAAAPSHKDTRDKPTTVVYSRTGKLSAAVKV